MNNPANFRPRWRVSEKTTAELMHTRRLNGCRSWDELFELLLEKLQKNSQPTPVKAQRNGAECRIPLENILIQIQRLHALMERQLENIHTCETNQEQIADLLQKINALLELVFVMGEDHLKKIAAVSSEISFETPEPPSLVNQIRRKRS